MDWHTLIDQMASGSVIALSRLITLVENRTPGWRRAMKQLYPDAGNAVIIGITGYPGSGKSTLTGQLARVLVERGNRLGIIAIDPSSHLSGGAFLGDRVRMNELSSMDDVYIRSMGSRGAVGGINQAARDVIKILDAFGKDYILVETVGAGQDEIDIAKAAQVVLLVCAPGQGDAIQYLKAGIMELADIYVANKNDLPESDILVHNIQSILMQRDTGDQKDVSFVKTIALQGEGIATLADEVEKKAGRQLMRDAWRRQQAIDDVNNLFTERLSEIATLNWSHDDELNGLVDDLLAGRMDPYTIADGMIIRSLEQMRENHGDMDFEE